MYTPRIFLDQDLSPNSEVYLPPDVTHHLTHVLRRKPGSDVRLFNGRGGEWNAELVQVGRSEAVARIIGHFECERESPLRMTLCQSVLKGDRMDWAIQKSVEMGVTDIQPVFTERCVSPMHGERLSRRMSHWRKIVISACEQSGRTRLPRVLAPASFTETVSRLSGCSLVMNPLGTRSLRSLNASNAVSVLVGPEAGFTSRELRNAEDHGCVGVRMGPRTLRAETAPLAALAAIQALWGDSG